jgi:hypothetical protein
MHCLKKATRKQDKDMKGIKGEKKGDEVSKCQKIISFEF